MNFLAHAYLSFNDPETLVGNMISDFVKGNRKLSYPIGIQNGIRLHRRIDEFTDDHLANRELKLIFKPHYGLYASPIMDVVHDHFMANYVEAFPNDDALMEFSAKTYDQLASYQELFPEKFARMFPYMRSQNWLFNYRTMDGIRQSMGGLQRRAKYLKEMDTAFQIFTENYKTLQAGFHEFFPELEEMTRDFFTELKK